MTKETTSAVFQDLLARLEAVRRKQHRTALAFGAITFLWLTSSAAMLALVAEGLLMLDVVPRTLVVLVVALVTAGALLRYVLPPALRALGILRSASNETLAVAVGRRFPRINDHMVNILQLFRERERSGYYSPELIDAAFADARAEMDRLDFTSAVETHCVRKAARLLGAAMGAAVVLFALFPATFSASAYRLVHFNETFLPLQPFHFIVEPGSKEVIKGESVPVTIRVAGEQQQRITLSSRPLGQVAYEETPLDMLADGTFRHEFPQLKISTTYRVRSADIASEEFTLTVIDRPLVRMLRVGLTFPAYTRLAQRQLDDNVGDIVALKGTQLTFEVESNKDLHEARLMFSDGQKLPLDVSRSRATGVLVLAKDRTYHIQLIDSDGIANVEPIEYSMKVIPDAYPQVSVLMPGEDVDIAENTHLPMLFKIADDYGFTSLRLAHRLVQSRYERPAAEYSFIPITIPEGIRTEGSISYNWLLKSLNLVPEDVVSYFVEVFDNDHVSGPKSARSETYTLRLPSLDEVFAGLDRQHDLSLDKLQSALEDVQEARRHLEQLQQDLQKNPKRMDWQEQKKAEELAKRYEEIQKRIDEVNASVDRMVEEMQQNQVLSRETLEKYQELQQLMEEMNSPEFAEAMKQLQQAMQQMTPDALRQALQEFKFSEENFRRSIERTMNLLKRIQIEQKVDEALRRMEEIMKQQEELHARAEQANPEDADKRSDLARQQEDLAAELDQLRKELAGLQEKMEEFPAEMPLQEMRDAREALDRSMLEELMRQLAQQMQAGQMQQAQQGQRQAMQQMAQFMEKLQQMQDALRQNQQQQIVNAMRKALQDLVELSRRQEALRNESRGLEPNSQRFRDNAQQQMDVMRDVAALTGSLSRLSQRTFGITPEMGKSIGDALREMNQAMQALEQRNGTAAANAQTGAMSSLNAAAQQMQNSMNAMMQGQGQGMGMAGFMQRLQQLTGMQQGINQGTQNLGGMTPEQAAAMGRLAGEQGMVRKSLEQLAREASQSGQLSRMLGDLNRIAQEMREVQTDLAQGNVNPETLRKQDRILSRLLDSQRSMRERDFEKRRRAETATNRMRSSPAHIDLTTQEGRNRLRQDLLKAIEEGYAKDYEELIRKYFDALERSGVQN